MENSTLCKIGKCCWALRHEAIGLILLIIGVYLTLATWDSFGIVALFLVGAYLLGPNRFGCEPQKNQANRPPRRANRPPRNKTEKAGNE